MLGSKISASYQGQNLIIASARGSVFAIYIGEPISRRLFGGGVNIYRQSSQVKVNK